MPKDKNKTGSHAGQVSKEAIILAGGLGTRLQSVVSDVPKCLAPVAGRPFLAHVIAYLQKQGVESFIFSLGYRHEMIEAFISQNYPHLEVQVSVEQEPLGTGGAILMACSKVTEKQVLVVNGDTLFKADLEKLLSFHRQNDAACTLALKPLEDFDRYGAVEINKEGYIQSFSEKKYFEKGLINGGVYALNTPRFLELSLPGAFSFEKDYLEKYYTTEKMMGLVQDAYFIDIGIPADLARAGNELAS